MARLCPSEQWPSLAAGDRVWIHPDFPEKEGARYVLVVAFLRGSVNPPPDNWFIKAETWNKKVRQEGVYVTVPEGARAGVAVSRPGDRRRLQHHTQRGARPPGSFCPRRTRPASGEPRSSPVGYLPGRRENRRYGRSQSGGRQTKLLARSLNIKVDQQCFDKPTEQQAPCLVQNPDSLVLDNGRSAKRSAGG